MTPVRAGLPLSEPRGRGVGGRDASLKRRAVDALQGMAVSPVQKRAAVYIQPTPTDPMIEATLNNEDLTKQVAIIRRTMEHMHKWTQSIAEAADDHATAIEAQSRELRGVKDKVIEICRDTEQKHVAAEAKLTEAAETFTRVDKLIEELKNDTKDTFKDVVARAAALEADLQKLQAVQATAAASASGSPGISP